jgi:serine protease Do
MRISTLISTLGKILALLSLYLAMAHGWFHAETHAATVPKLHIEDTPIPREERPAVSFAPVVKKVAASVVSVNVTKHARPPQGLGPQFDDPSFRRFFGLPGGPEDMPPDQPQRGLGSGVIISEDGYILTNNHVIDGADEIKVGLPDDKTRFDAKIIGTDPQTDIAVIKIESKNLPAITVTDSDKVEVGDVVLAIGNPFGVGQTVTTGIASAKGRGGMAIVDYEDFIQTDASITPGNSGGALVDAEGRLIGINTAILSRSGGNQGIGFAVPINLARYILERSFLRAKSPAVISGS